MSTQQEYAQKLLRCRSATNRAQAIASTRIEEVLRQANRDISRLLKLTTRKTLTFANYTAKQEAINNVLHQLSLDINTTTRLGIRGASEAVTKLYSGFTAEYADGRGFAFNWAGTFNTVPLEATRNVIGRLWQDGRDFSSRIWRMNQLAESGVKNIVTAGVARGQSAVSMSKDLRRFLVNPDLTPTTTWTTGVKKSITGRGTIHYNALRLARTEINNAYRETMVMTNQKNPIMAGVKWHISARHPVLDVCDVWAESDLYGLGPGVFPANATPIDHVGGLCFFTDVVRSSKLWGSPKAEPAARIHSRSAIMKPLTTKNVLTDGQLNQAWKMFDGTQKLVRQVYKKAA